MKPGKTHLEKECPSVKHQVTMCGQRLVEAGRFTWNPDNVTCNSCKRVMGIDALKAKAELVDELMTELKECVEWIKTDISYKAPEQLQEMASERWLPKIMSTCESLLKKAEGK